MATTYRIHPAIGIARVGNGPDEYFIGPERVRELPDPPGGFKDAQCRVKRQAARFRIFAHHDDGSVDEITASEADITWSVHIANKKAAFPGRGNPEPVGELTIDPDSRSLATPNASAVFDGGTIAFFDHPVVEVPLGEIRTDDHGRLLVLGGAGNSASPGNKSVQDYWANAGWYDDISDGPVTASITLHENAETRPVLGAWVIVAPPKFAPHQDSVTTLYDRLFQQMVDDGLLPVPGTTSYTRDVHPILQRTRDMAWVEGTTAVHQWPDPVTDQTTIDTIFSRITKPAGGGGNMPRLHGSDQTLTPTQYLHLQRWKNGTYDDDWAGTPEVEPAVTPDGLDRAALEACVGAAFYPGIEAGGRQPGERPVLEKSYGEPFRFDHAHSGAGDITASMALPWQADFKACVDEWWPVPRPNDVLTTVGGSMIRWEREVGSMEEMVAEWSSLGFVVQQGSAHVEVQACDVPSIVLLTPHLDFRDVPQWPMAGVREVVLAITFEVVSASAGVTLEYDPGGAPNHPQLVAVNTSVTTPATGPNTVATARLWVVFRTGAAGMGIPTQTLTVREPVSGRTWQVSVDGNTIPRATTAVALVLDRSGSMNEDRGDGQSKHHALQQAADLFVDLMLEGDRCGVVGFNQDAQVLQQVVPLGDGQPTDQNRNAARDAINGTGLDPFGATSIGDGIFEARGILDDAPPSDHDAIVVLTDGVENQPRWIADVAAQIDATTFAVGLGTPQSISVRALQTIAGNTGGYVAVTGAITNDTRFRLQKHFLQILSGVDNSEVVLDPGGTLTPGRVVRIPFLVSDADTALEVVLLTPAPDRVDFRLLSPLGRLIEPWQAGHDAAMAFRLSNGSAFYRLALPLQIEPGRFDQAGTWHVLMRLGEPRTDPRGRPDASILEPATPATVEPEPSEPERRFALARGHAPVVGGAGTGEMPTDDCESGSVGRSAVPFEVVVHAWSNVAFRARVEQDGLVPGAPVSLFASLTESGLPVQDATVWATVAPPAGSLFDVPFVREGDGWTGTFDTTTAGVYDVRLRSRGRTRAAVPFARERLVTAAAWHGADRPGDPAGDPRPPTVANRSGDHAGLWCDLLSCLLGSDGVIGDPLRERLSDAGIDIDRVLECLEGCKDDVRR